VQVLATRMPVLITMLEGVNEIRRGSLGDAYRAARAPVVTWSAVEAGISDLGKCGLRGSPTIVKKVFAPSPRAEKARQLATPDLGMEGIAEAALSAIFDHQPALEADLLRFASSR